jgi:hypothetical protein
MKGNILSLLFLAAGCGVIAIAAAQPATADDATRAESLTSVGTALKKVSSALRKKGLAKLPSAAAALSTNRSRSTVGGKGASPQSVSGTPPLLTAISHSTEIENIFWRPNVVASIAAGVADQTQCGEFFSGSTDGVSSGLQVCELAEGIGFSFQSIVDAQINLCYLKLFPTKKNLQSGGIAITRGRNKVPNKDFTQIFSAGDTSRTVRIHTPQIDELGISAQNIFVKIPATSANKNRKNIYQAEIYFCPDGALDVSGFNKITVTEAGKLSIVTSNFSDPANGIGNTNSIQGFLDASNGILKWDTSKQRTASIDTVQSSADTFKSSIKISADNLISIKRRNFFQSVINQQFSISRFTGANAFVTAFPEGAYKGESIDNAQTTLFSGATEYRDTFYAAAPGASLASRVNSYDLAGDSFYASGPEINTNRSRYSCTARGDIEIDILPDSQELVTALKPCIENRLSGMDFCARSTLVTQALQNYSNACR